MAHGFEAGGSIEGTGEDTGSVLFIRLPEQARAAFLAKSTLRNLGCAIPLQAAVFDDCDIVFLGFGMGTKDTMQFSAHAAVAMGTPECGFIDVEFYRAAEATSVHVGDPPIP